MPSNEQSLSTLYRGDTRIITVTVQDGLGVPVDITGDTITLTLSPTRQSTPVATKVNGVGDHDDPTAGVTVFILTPEDTASASAKNHHIDITRVSAGNVTTTLFIGTIRIEDKVSIVA